MDPAFRLYTIVALLLVLALVIVRWAQSYDSTSSVLHSIGLGHFFPNLDEAPPTQSELDAYSVKVQTNVSNVKQNPFKGANTISQYYRLFK
jgi:hypothetical protein